MKRRKFIKNNLKVVAASSLPFTVSFDNDMLHDHKPGKNSFKVGFAKTDISPCIKEKGKFRKPLEAICANLNDNGTRTFLITLDLTEMPLAENRRIQEGISEKSGIPIERLVIHTTHTHSTPWNGEVGYTETEDLSDVLAKCISEAIEVEKPAVMKTGNYDVGKSLSVYRLGYAGDELGFQTFWYGYAYRGNDARPDASPLINEMKSRWRNQAPDYSASPEPVWFDRDVDPLVQSIQFADHRGHILGTMVRFSAHPILTNHCNNRMYDPDYPGFVREHLFNMSHAPVMFLSGTCGNTVPKDKVKYKISDEVKVKFPYMGPTWALKVEKDEDLLTEAKRIGETIGDASTKGLKNGRPSGIEHFSFNSFYVSLPLDPNLPANKKEMEKMKNMLLEELYASSRMKAPLREMRGIANRLNELEWSGSCGFRSLNQKERDKGIFNLPVTALKLNDTVLLFMNTEISVETTVKLRKQFPGLNLFTVGLTGGTTGYLPTAQMVDEGGYEGRSTVFARDAEEKLRTGIGAVLSKLV